MGRKTKQKTTKKGKTTPKVKVSKKEFKISSETRKTSSVLRDVENTSKKTVSGKTATFNTKKELSSSEREKYIKSLPSKIDWRGVDSKRDPDWQTRDAHIDNGKYHSYRETLHESILRKSLNKGESSKKPIAVLVGGGTASGKSTVLNKEIMPIFQKNKIPVVMIDADDFKNQLPEYGSFKRKNTKSAAFRVHEESADLTEVAIDRAIKQKKNLIFDGTMKNTPKYKKLVKRLRKNGYKISIVVVTVPVEIAKDRSRKRAKRTGRFVPMAVVEKSHAGVPKTFRSIKNDVDNYVVYDTTDTSVKIAENDIVYNKQKFNKFSD